jgi:hypothetical protein
MLASSALGLLVGRSASRGPIVAACLARGRSTVSIAVQDVQETLQDAPAVQEQVVRPFDHVPGPKGMPLIGNSWRFLPVIGEFFLFIFLVWVELFFSILSRFVSRCGTNMQDQSDNSCQFLFSLWNYPLCCAYFTINCFTRHDRDPSSF